MQKLDNLQTLRAIAACLVIVCHSIGNYTTWHHLSYPSENVIWDIGKLGVGMFFVISGFIMMYIHHDDFHKKEATISFYIKRLVRVVPMYWIFTLIVALKLYLQGRDIEIIDLFKSLLFIPYQNSAGLWRPIHDLGWTLNLEMYFYFIFGFALLLNKKIGMSFLIISILLPLLLNHFYSMVPFYSDPVVIYFLIGIFIFHFKNSQKLNLNINGNTIFIICIVVITTVFSLNLSTNLFTKILAILLPFLAVICSSKIKPFKSVTHVGNASYSLYLVHPLVIGAFLSIFKKLPVLPHIFGMMSYVLLCLVASIIVAHFIYIYVEKPIINYFKKSI